MICIKASRSAAFNEAVIRSLLNWRRNSKLIQRRYHETVAPEIADTAAVVVSHCFHIRMLTLYTPVFMEMARLEDSFARIGRP